VPRSLFASTAILPAGTEGQDKQQKWLWPAG
jgi:hypothetical protein